jgi:methylmalonyl-CoA carboxyltransferase large subunit
VDGGSFEEFGLFAQHRQVHFGMADKEVRRRRRHQRTADGPPRPPRQPGLPVLGSSAGEIHSYKVADVMERSLKTGSPFVFINDSGGARIQEGVESLAGYAEIFQRNVLASGVCRKSH